MKIFLLIPLLVFGPWLFSQENNGISTYQLADRIFTKYDRDQDGILDVADDSFLRTSLPPSEPGARTVIKVESHGLLFTDADQAGNQDGRVSPKELEDFLGEFDTNRDGEITWGTGLLDLIFFRTSEWEKFQDLYGERFKYSESP